MQLTVVHKFLEVVLYGCCYILHCPVASWIVPICPSRCQHWMTWNLKHSTVSLHWTICLHLVTVLQHTTNRYLHSYVLFTRWCHFIYDVTTAEGSHWNDEGTISQIGPATLAECTTTVRDRKSGENSWGFVVSETLSNGDRMVTTTIMLLLSSVCQENMIWLLFVHVPVCLKRKWAKVSFRSSGRNCYFCYLQTTANIIKHINMKK